MNKMEFDIGTYNMDEPYSNYLDLCNIFDKKPQLNILDFMNLYSIFCFDVSAQNEKLVVNGCNITVEIEKDSALKLKSYIVVLEEKKVDILIKAGKMFSVAD